MSVGSVNTVIYYLFLEQSIKIPEKIAALMLSGILSDTLLFASPTTTDTDKEVAEKLSKITGINISEYGLELLTSGVSIEGLTEEEVIYKDFKTYTAGDHRVGVAQVFTTSFLEYKKNIKKYIEALNNISTNNNYKVVCLFVTDILNNDSYLIYNESAKKYIEDAYGIFNLTQGHLLKGVVSRKKQMVPLILEVIEKVYMKLKITTFVILLLCISIVVGLAFIMKGSDNETLSMLNYTASGTITERRSGKKLSLL